jgi:hypothetical protein
VVETLREISRLAVRQQVAAQQPGMAGDDEMRAGRLEAVAGIRFAAV